MRKSERTAEKTIIIMDRLIDRLTLCLWNLGSRGAGTANRNKEVNHYHYYF